MKRVDYVSKLVSIAQSGNPNDSVDVRIAQTMLSHLHELGILQNQKIASMCYVDAATVSRFVRHLGFLKYGEFKSYFKEYNEIHNQNYYFNKDRLPTPKKIVDDAINAIKKSYALLDEQKLNEIVKLIKNSKEILVAGDRFSQLVAQDFQMKLLSLGIYAKTYSDIQLQYEEVYRNKGLFILFSASYTKSKTIVNEVKKRGWETIIITRNQNVKEEHVLYYDESANSTWTVNSVTDRLCMGIIVDQIILKIANSAINGKC